MAIFFYYSLLVNNLAIFFSNFYSNTVGIWIQTTWIPETFWSSDFKWFGIKMAGICAMSCVLDRTFEYQTSLQKMVHLSGILMFGLSGIQMAFKYWTIWHPTSSTIWILYKFGIQIPTVTITSLFSENYFYSYSDAKITFHDLNSVPFDNWTHIHGLNTGLFIYLNPDCVCKLSTHVKLSIKIWWRL